MEEGAEHSGWIFNSVQCDLAEPNLLSVKTLFLWVTHPHTRVWRICHWEWSSHVTLEKFSPWIKLLPLFSVYQHVHMSVRSLACCILVPHTSASRSLVVRRSQAQCLECRRDSRAVCQMHSQSSSQMPLLSVSPLLLLPCAFSELGLFSDVADFVLL